jgi:hypothetical protein
MNTKLYLNNELLDLIPDIIDQDEKLGQHFTVDIKEGRVLEIEKMCAGHSSRYVETYWVC